MKAVILLGGVSNWLYPLSHQTSRAMLPVGNAPANLVIGEIVHFHVRDGLYDAATGRIDLHRLQPVGRLAGNLYTHVHDIFEMKRPSASYRG